MEIILQVEGRKPVVPRENHMAPGLGLAQVDVSRGRLVEGHWDDGYLVMRRRASTDIQ